MYNLSPSKLGIFKNCKRCFWDMMISGIQRPRGAFPSLPGGMDLILKGYMDSFRGGMPPELAGQVPGKLYDNLPQLNRWRNWRTGLTVAEKKYRLIGAIDDLLNVEGKLAPLDFKTKGSKPATDGSEYYQHQMDMYAFMLKYNGFPILEAAFLAYFWPITVEPRETSMILPVHFGCQTFELEANPDRAEGMIFDAIDVLDGPRPDPNPECEYCNYALSAGQQEAPKQGGDHGKR